MGKMMHFITCEERKEFSASPLDTKGQSNGGQLLDAVQTKLYIKTTIVSEAFTIKLSAFNELCTFLSFTCTMPS